MKMNMIRKKKMQWVLLLGLCGMLSAFAQTPEPSPQAKPTPTPWPEVTPPADPAKFDLILLVGQSNMAGRGTLTEADRVPDPRVYTLDRADRWVNQGQPIHFDKPVAGAGIGFYFGKQLADANPGVTVGLIPCAVGGTSVKLWQPGQKLYEDALKRAKIAQKSGRLKAILWHQGESDSGKQESVDAYAALLKTTLESFRKDLNAPNVPIILGELGEFGFVNKEGTPTLKPKINEIMHAVAAEIPNTTVVSAKGLTDRGDKLHFSTEALQEFGKRYFEAWQKRGADNP